MGSMFDSRKVLHAFPKDGSKVVFKKPATIHWFTCVVKDQELLELGKEYTVRKTELNSSSSYIWLEEIECYDQERDLPFFSVHCFEWQTPELDPKDLIGFFAREATVAANNYNVGIEYGDFSYKNSADKIIVLVCDEYERITDAYYKQ